LTSSRKDLNVSLPLKRGRRLARVALLSVVLGISAGAQTGCLEWDSFMDPSVVGRWEHTPTVVPILERIDVIERDTGELVDVTPVEPADLIPEPTDYRVAPGDLLEIDILDFITSGVVSNYQRSVSSRGFVDIPQVGRVQVSGLTREQIEDALRQAIIDAEIIDDPLVTVQVPGRRQATFAILGAIDGVGRYAIPTPDYRLLEAVTDAGGVSPAIARILVIRQVTLTDEQAPPEHSTRPAPVQQPNDTAKGQDLLELIDELTAPDDEKGGSKEEPPLPNPGLIGGANERTDLRQLAGRQPGRPADDLLAMHFQQGDSQEGKNPTPPPIDLPDSTLEQERGTRGAIAEPRQIEQGGRWVFMGGEWVRIISGGAPVENAGLGEGPNPLDEVEPDGPLVTQRVIEVPVKPLLQGVAKFNIVVRPGDILSVPGPEQGLVYVGGPGIARPGVYNMPLTGKLTLQRLVFSAGGLSAIATPKKVDLTRIVGGDRQATIRVNLRAIFAGTQPYILLKPDDLINIGTSFWATPLAVIRGGLRASYGFGFLLDRNFGNDVFGAPPTNTLGQ